jgi:hypothetical protein
MQLFTSREEDEPDYYDNDTICDPNVTKEQLDRY